ncbi:hypothetical protein NXF25_018770 [Crotalus adamanteus]|uniref:Uncharacterized protein n=1 Tax=Crotalus adamanteus TaxID=8729 RepID=A0AAW1B0H2_CROAD
MFIQHVYCLHGTPRRIISDRLVGSSQGLSSAYHPSTNGAAERANAMVERYLRSYVSFQQTDWVDLLPFAEVAYNNTVHSSTRYTPFKIVHGMEFIPIPEWSQEADSLHTPQTWISQITGLWGRVKEAQVKAEEAVKAQADKKRAEHKPFRVGDWMYFSTKYLRLKIPCKKLGPKYVGPFQVTKVINPVTIRLQLPSFLGRVHPVFHSSLLKPAHGPSYAKAPGPVVGSRYEVQEVLDSRVRRGRVQYLLRWKGYPLTDATWVGEEDINAPRLIRAFHHRCPGRPGIDGCNTICSTSPFSFPGGAIVGGPHVKPPGACHANGGGGMYKAAHHCRDPPCRLSPRPSPRLNRGSQRPIPGAHVLQRPCRCRRLQV